MKQSVKGVLASIGISTLISGGSLPLMAADQPESPQVKEGKAGKKCAGMKKVVPTVKESEVTKSAVELKDNVAGKKCAGMTPAVQVDASANAAK
jgi:hypothetical protein